MHAVLKRGKKASKSPQWTNVVTCIETNFFQTSDDGGPSTFISMWSDLQKRGALKFVKNAVFVFFMALTMILKQIEEPDGSIPHEKIFAAMENDPIVILWDEIVGNTLSHEDSSFLRKELVTSFANTWGVGIALRRNNELKDKNRDKIPFRGTLLPRKN